MFLDVEIHRFLLCGLVVFLAFEIQEIGEKATGKLGFIFVHASLFSWTDPWVLFVLVLIVAAK